MKTKPQNLQPHPLGALFPPMSDDQYATLLKSLKERGYDKKEPIMVFEGKILDGNHRYTGVKKLKMLNDAEFLEFKGDYAEAIGYVTGKNLGRRHMNPSQSAAAGAELVELLKAQEKEADEAAAAAKAKGGKKGKADPKLKRAIPRKKGSKAAAAAKAVGVSERSVATAVDLKKNDPAAFEDVKSGKTSLNSAAVKSGVKKSAAEKASEEFAKAKGILDGLLGDGFTETATKKLNSKDIIKMSGLDTEELKRIKPYIESNWKLAAALGYKSTQLSNGHTLRQLIDRAIGEITEANPVFKLLIGEHVIEVRKQTTEEKTV